MSDGTGTDAKREEIARRAYERFCDRGCADGGDVEDWLAAEQEVLAEQRPVQPQMATAADSASPRNRKSGR